MDHRPDLQRRRRTDHPVSDAPEPRVGYIGLGNIGTPMAKRLRRLARRPVGVRRRARPGGRARGGGGHGGRQRRRAGRDGRRHLRDGARRRRRSATCSARCSGVARDGLTVAIHSTIGPDTPSHLADTAIRHGVHLVDAPVSGGAMGAADRDAGDHGGRLRRGVRRVCRTVRADGQQGRPCRPDRGRHPDEAGPQPAALRRVHGRHARRSAWPRPPGSTWSSSARWSGTPTRSPAGPGAIMYRDNTAPLAPDDFVVRRLRARPGAGREGPALRHRAGRRAGGRRTPGPRGAGTARPRARPARHHDEGDDLMTDKFDGLPETRRRGPREDGAGLRLRHAATGRATSSATPRTTCSPTSGTGPGCPTGTGGCC